MKIEVLYFDGCPSWQKGLENLRNALIEEKIDAEVSVLSIQGDDQAIKEKFLGSPSFRINGRDLWPYERESYDLGCRVYQTPGGFKGFPTVAMLRGKIKEAGR